MYRLVRILEVLLEVRAINDRDDEGEKVLRYGLEHGGRDWMQWAGARISQ